MWIGGMKLVWVLGFIIGLMSWLKMVLSFGVWLCFYFFILCCDVFIVGIYWLIYICEKINKCEE